MRGDARIGDAAEVGGCQHKCVVLARLEVADVVVAVVRRVQIDIIGADAAVENIEAGAADQTVIAASAEDRIVGILTVQIVVAVLTVELVIACIPEQDIVEADPTRPSTAK
jgi:hypothetical protein